MNQAKKTAYRDLLLKLLVCSGEQLSSVLESHPNLVDAGLVIEMENMAKRIRSKTPFEADFLTELAKGLKNYLKFCKESNQNQPVRTPIGSDLAKNTSWQFWVKLLQTNDKHQENSEPVYNLLSENLSLLNLDLIPIMEMWIQNSITQYPEKTLDIAAQLVNLSINIQQFPQGNRRQHSEIAIAGYNLALKVHKKEKFLELRATTLTNLGISYSLLAQLGKESQNNLKQAIRAYDEAADILRQLGLKKELGLTLNNLGISYRVQAELGWEPQYSLNQAIKVYKEAAQIFRQLDQILELASTFNNLGRAYQTQAELGRESEKYLRKAIETYSEGIKLLHPLNFSIYLGLDLEILLAKTFNNLGNAYYSLADLELQFNRQTYSTQAIELYNQSPEIFPLPAQTYLIQAITLYSQSAEIFREKSLEPDLALALTSLAISCCLTTKIIKKPQIYLKKALTAYDEVFKIAIPNLFPIECLRAGRNLGDFGFKQNDWQLAIKGYYPAIQAIETNRNWSKTDDERQLIMTEALKIYSNLIHSYIQLGQYDLALQTIERSRSRRLVDLMASKDFYSLGDIPSSVQILLQQYDSFETKLEQLRRNYSTEEKTDFRSVLNPYNQYTAQIRAMEAQKQDLWEQLRHLDPVLAGEIQVIPLQLQEIHSLLGNNSQTALLTFYTTNQGTHVLVLRTTSQNKPKISHHFCPEKTEETLQQWLIDQWFKPYQAYRLASEKSEQEALLGQWITSMPKCLNELAQRLSLRKLVSKHLQEITQLILIPHYSLHLIPFTALPLKDNLLGERFKLRIVPSAQILKFCCDRLSQSINNNPRGQSFAMIENATDNLAFSQYECNFLAEYFQVPHHQRLRGRTMATREQCSILLRQSHIQSLHASHHATSRFDKPLESALIWGDGQLTLGELMSLSWRLPHLKEVFLSCCETNLGIPKPTDDIFTLAVGFLCAGANTVISTLWAIDDLATAWFTIFYYEARYPDPNTVVESAISLQTAQNRLRNQTIGNLLPQIDDAINVLKTELAESSRQPERKAFYNTLSKAHSNLSRQLKKWKKLPSQTKPYESPYYWAGFVAQGL